MVIYLSHYFIRLIKLFYNWNR